MTSNKIASGRAGADLTLTRRVALLPAILLGVYLLLTSTLTLVPALGIYDAKRILQFGLLLALLSAVLGWPGIPESPPAAVGAALTGVVLLWLAGTRGLLEGRS